MKFHVVVEPRAIEDIQDAIDYYDSRQIGLGEQFYEALNEHINSLETNPYYQLKYKDYNGLPIKKFPFILLYYIDENSKTVFIMSVFNT